MYRSSPFRSTLNTNVITGLDMCQVCTEAVHFVASHMCASTRNVIIPKLTTPFKGKNSIFLHVANGDGSKNKALCCPFGRTICGTDMILGPKTNQVLMSPLLLPRFFKSLAQIAPRGVILIALTQITKGKFLTNTIDLHGLILPIWRKCMIFCEDGVFINSQNSEIL